MSEITADIQQQFEDQVLVACDRIFTEGVRRMRADLEKAGLVLTQELKNSLYSERTSYTDKLEAEFRMGMRGTGRFKDMKQISFSKLPDVASMIEYVEELGVDKFINNETVVTKRGKTIQLYVPGYHIGRKPRKELTHQRAALRIAYGMARYMKEANTVKRRANSFYNVNKNDIYWEIVDYLMTKLPPTMLQAMKEYYERPVWEKE